MAIIKYTMEVGDRYYPNKDFEKFCGIKGREEIVSLGCLSLYAKYHKELFSYVELDDYRFLGQPSDEYVNGSRLIKEISIEEAIKLVDKTKKELVNSHQLVYSELYSEVMNYKTEPFPNLTDFEFCGYEITNGGAISLITGCGDVNIKHVDKLNQYGLFSKIEDAKFAQEKIAEEHLDHDSVNTIIYGIWRYINK